MPGYSEKPGNPANYITLVNDEDNDGNEDRAYDWDQGFGKTIMTVKNGGIAI